jgi:TolB-like protein/DNA-binding winged helix-turn-helix (wHTH) protein
LCSGELRKQGIKIKLHKQPFQILAMLLEHPGDVVTREQLQQRLWPPDTFVDFDEGLNSAIKKLRDALADSAEAPRYVETLPRRGYRFIAAVENIPSPAPHDLAVQVDDSSTAPATPLSDKVAALPVESSKASLRARLWIAAGAGAAALLALFVGLNTGGLRQRLLRASAAGRIQSIAVLPLENLSGDPSQEYFADGMTEALITDLGKISELRVVSRTSAMHYKGTRKTLPEIARELNVDAVVEGAVLRSGDRVRITAQLVEAPSDRHLWAESYERDLRHVLDVQDEVARDVANEIKIKLTPQEQAQLASGRPVDPEAHEAYLRGRYEWNKWTEEGLNKSIEYFEKAIQKDPPHAQAWAGLSDAYGLMGTFDFLPPEVAFPKAKGAALKALELDETLSEAHVALGGVMLHPEWSWSAAEKESQRAIALNPNNATAHQWYGYYLTIMGRFDKAIAEMKCALELDPLSSNEQHSLAATLYRAGRYDEALQYFHEVPDPDANSERRHRWMAAIYERKGIQKEAIAELLTALRFAGEKDLAEQVERKYASSGYSEAKKTFLWGDIKEKQKTARNSSGQASWIAADYALLEEKDKAFDWLEKAFQQRDMGMIYLKVNDSFEALRSDPRFQDLLRRMDLPP